MSFLGDLLKKEDVNKLIGLTDELKTIYINNNFKDRSVLFVTNSLYEANQFYNSFSNYNNDVLLFPMDDFLTSEALAISPELKMTRLETLNALLKGKNKIVITNLMGFLRYLPLKKVFFDHYINLKKNIDYKIADLVNDLYNIGYERQAVVNKTGEISVRGFVVDLFPIDLDYPIRIEYWGDTIESIRYFDIDTQLTIKEIDEVLIVPNTEFITDKNGSFEKQRDLPLYGKVTNIASYLDDVKVVFNDFEGIKNAYKLLLEDMQNYSLSQNLPKNTKYMNSLDDIDLSNALFFENFGMDLSDSKNEKCYESYLVEPFSGNASLINKRLNEYLRLNKTIVICVSNRYQVTKLMDYLANKNMVFTKEDEIFKGKINLIIKKINNGFTYDSYVVISENEIFNKKTSNFNYKTKFRYGKKIRDITKINIGDYVVHMNYGIGIYAGLKTLDKNGLKKDYLEIRYKDNDKLYIPVEKIDLISKYSSNDGAVPKINRLNGVEWEKTKLRVKGKIKEMAMDLLDLYAKRESSKGFAFPKDTDMQIAFEKEFMYKETADQLRVTDQIKEDMEKPVPMDRLLCGDVGYGKTEVAFRAMFKAVMANKQVAMLCPTTILSNQHYQNALERFKSFPVNIALINRFVTKKELSDKINEIKEGKVDIVIGTHRLLSDDIVFKDLGLLVVDEEQRFGVKHKEKIKNIKNNVDVLTLSATPIPRTLQMSLGGVRDLSLIETPPINRYPIQTYVLASNNQVIKDAIYKEISRNGQVFILYNHIADIEIKLNQLIRLMPDIKATYIHGRMDKRQIEDIMFKFYNNEFNVLLCTTIIETGIDIPNVNTLIVMDADRFGLAQLYQIRGRVGRAERIAYCYLMYEPGRSLSDVAIKRLNVIKEFTELGSGFSIAMRDLSIRGAGNLLGEQQSGFIDSVGVELFMKMLNDEVTKLKGQDIKEEETKEPLISVSTTIDDNYILDEDIKIEIHKKINTIDSYDKLFEVKNEIEDRFGNISEDLLVYMYEEWFEKMASELNIKKVVQTKNFVQITLPKELTQKIDGQLLFLEVSQISRMFRFSMAKECLVITLDTIKLDKHFIYYLIELVEIIKKAIS